MCVTHNNISGNVNLHAILPSSSTRHRHHIATDHFMFNGSILMDPLTRTLSEWVHKQPDMVKYSIHEVEIINWFQEYNIKETFLLKEFCCFKPTVFATSLHMYVN